MKLIAKLAVAGAIALAAATPAAAATQFIGTFTANATGVDPGLKVQTDPLIAGLNFVLNNPGSTYGVDLFQVWTDEATLELVDDYAHRPIGVNFAFTAPSPAGGSVTGDTFGASFFGLFQSGRLVWDNGGDALINFANGGKLLAHLDNATFNAGGLADGLHEGYDYGAPVHATFTLVTAPVPEPATWAMMILGMGMVGAGLRLRNRRVLSAT